MAPRRERKSISSTFLWVTFSNKVQKVAAKRMSLAAAQLFPGPREARALESPFCILDDFIFFHTMH